ncbi:MAG: SxtJ family membrane protein, partial [Puniceicoccales bacterium]
MAAKGSKSVSHETLREDKLEVGSDRSFGYIFGGACIIFSLILSLTKSPWFGILGAIGLVFVLMGLVLPAKLHTLNVLWMKFGGLLHHIISPIALGLIFWLAVVPTALFVRLSGKDPLRMKKDA